MMPTILALTAILCAADPPADTDTKPMRKPHPLAPSLPELTKEEEDKNDDIINRFIKADSGQTKGEEAKQAQRDFDALGPEAIPALLRGLNRAAQLEHSCPTIMIAKKLSRLLMASDDQKLLEFARDEIGAGVPRGKHAGILAELRTQCLVRKNALARATPPPTLTTGAKTPRTMTNADLIAAANKESGDKLKPLLAELEQRKGPEILPGYSSVVATFVKNMDTETQQTVRASLDRYMARQTATFMKDKLKDKDVEIRRAAVRSVAKFTVLLPNLIDALADEDAEVRADAHQTLLKVSKGEDFGPDADAKPEQIKDAQTKWRSWLAKTTGR